MRQIPNLLLSLTLTVLAGALFVQARRDEWHRPAWTESVDAPSLQAPRWATLPAEAELLPAPARFSATEGREEIRVSFANREQARAFDQINGAYGRQDWAEGAGLGETFLKRWPDSPAVRRLVSSVYGNWGVGLHNEGKYQEAVKLLVRSVELDNEAVESLIGIGMASLNLMDMETAEKTFRYTAEKFPRNGRAYFGLGEVAYRRHDLERARTFFESALKYGAPGTHAPDRLRKTMEEMQAERNNLHLENEHFLISYPLGVDAGFANWAMSELETGLREIGGELGVETISTLPVIFSGGAEFSASIGAPHWASGIYDGKIRIPIQADYKTSREQYRKFLRHELTHALVAYATGNNCPTWLNEGLAQLAEGVRIQPRTHDLLLRAVRGKYLAPLDELEQAFVQIGDPELAKLAYDESLAAAEYLQARYPRSAIRTTLKELRGGAKLEAALQKATGKNYGELLASMGEYYR